MSEFKNWQIIQRHVGAKVDGYPGRNTAFKIIEHFRREQKREENADVILKIQKKDGAKIILPNDPEQVVIKDFDAVEMPPNKIARFPVQSQKNMFRVFGTPGIGMTMVDCPYELSLSWDLKTKIKSFACHSLVKESLEGILNDTFNHYGGAKIKELGLDRFGGCLNVRKKRGGNTWSMHAWGAAVDFWPEKNRLRWGRDKAEFAKPEYEAFLDIVEAHGWISLGREANFDWMHIQAPPLR